jgi:hypothetical protein
MWRPHWSVCPFATWYQLLKHLSDFLWNAMYVGIFFFFFYKICPGSTSFVVICSVRNKCIASHTVHISWLIGDIQYGRICIVLFCSCEFVKIGVLIALLHLRAWQNFTNFFLHFGVMGLKFGKGDVHKNLLDGCEFCKNWHFTEEVN